MSQSVPRNAIIGEGGIAPSRHIVLRRDYDLAGNRDRMVALALPDDVLIDHRFLEEADPRYVRRSEDGAHVVFDLDNCRAEYAVTLEHAGTNGLPSSHALRARVVSVEIPWGADPIPEFCDGTESRAGERERERNGDSAEANPT